MIHKPWFKALLTFVAFLLVLGILLFTTDTISWAHPHKDTATRKQVKAMYYGPDRLHLHQSDVTYKPLTIKGKTKTQACRDARGWLNHYWPTTDKKVWEWRITQVVTYCWHRGVLTYVHWHDPTFVQANWTWWDNNGHNYAPSATGGPMPHSLDPSRRYRRVTFDVKLCSAFLFCMHKSPWVSIGVHAGGKATKASGE